MPHNDKLLFKTIGIILERPYQSVLVPTQDERYQIPGIATFRVENDMVHFEFHADEPELFNEPFARDVVKSAHGEAVLDIAVPSAHFRHSVQMTTLSPPIGGFHTLADGTQRHWYRPYKGILATSKTTPTSSFGDANTPMDRVVVRLLDLPSKWYSGNLAYQYGISKLPLKFAEDGNQIIEPGNIGSMMISGCTINADGWSVEIQEIPSEHRDNQRATHWCAITRSDRKMTGTSAWQFFEDEIRPFLRFVFAQNVQAESMTGEDWINLQHVRSQTIKTNGANWFLATWYEKIDLQPLFQTFHSQTDEIKKHWRKVIWKYAISEEIRAAIDIETAEAVSFAGLEGLTRSIISGYGDRDKWLDTKTLKMKPPQGKGIKDAIEKVLKAELGTTSPVLTEALAAMLDLRNDTAHTDLLSDPDPKNIYHRWNASQALIEILLLNKMGLRRIPNRTSHGTAYAMGIDLYEEARREEVLSRRCQKCGAWTGTLTHEECDQSLCSPCWSQHTESGCVDPVFPPAQ